MNLKPAPFELLGHIVAATLGDRPADMKGMLRVHLHHSPLADEIRGQMEPADVPAVMRPDCTSSPSKPFPRPTVVVGHEPPRVALLEAAVSAPVEFPNLDRPGIAQKVPVNPARTKIALPPLKDPRSTIVVRPTKPIPRLMADIRREQLAGAVAFLKRQGILVSVVDREAPVRKYRVTGKVDSKFHEEVIEIAVARGFEVPA